MTGANLRRLLHEHEWELVGLAAVTAFALGLWGYAELDDRSVRDDIYRSLQLFVLEAGSELSEPPLQLEIARYLAPAVAAYALVRAVLLVLRERVRALALRRLRDHVIVAGSGPDAIQVIRSFAPDGGRVAAVADTASDAWKQAVASTGAIPVPGVAVDAETFERAGVRHARHAFLLCASDARSIEAGDAALEAAEDQGSGVEVFTRISDPQLRVHRAAFALTRSDPTGATLEVFDPIDVGARIVVEERGRFLDDAVRSDAVPSAVVGGMGPIGEAVTLHLARAWRSERPDDRTKVRLVLVDPNASGVAARLRATYPELDELCTFDGRDATLDSPEWLRGEPFEVDGAQLVGACFLCADEEEDVLSASLSAYYRLLGSPATITVCVTEATGTARAVLDDLKDEPVPVVHSMIELACAPEVVLRGTRELLARWTHEDYVRNERAKGTPENPSMAPWDELDEGLRESNRAQVDHMSTKLAELRCGVVPAVFRGPRPQINFSDDEIEDLAKAEHKRWMDERIAAEWVYGPVKDVEKKTNPSLVDWADLPDPERDKDRATIRELPRRLELAGFALVRS